MRKDGLNLEGGGSHNDNLWDGKKKEKKATLAKKLLETALHYDTSDTKNHAKWTTISSGEIEEWMG